MWDLFLPFLIGLMIGIDPSSGHRGARETVMTPSENSQTEQAASTTVMADDTGANMIEARTPEDQTPTGQFTTAAEVKPILGMTKSNWVAVREYEGQGLLYFTHLLNWRCGLWDIRYGINGAAPDQLIPLEPCHEGTAQPNALTDIENFLPYLSFELGSVQSVSVRIEYDDATMETAEFDRSAILMP